jgi:NAD-reducing hydrogenase small subunit
MDRIKFATVWLGGCAGCHMSFLDLDEFLLDLAGRVEVVYSPIADVKEYPEGVDLCLIEGAVCNEDNLELLHRVRARTKVLVSFGDCAVTCNVTSLRNYLGEKNADQILQRAYIDAADTNPVKPGLAGIVPRLLPVVRPVHDVVPVEHFLPGCPPPAPRIKAFLTHLLDQTPALSGTQLKFG